MSAVAESAAAEQLCTLRDGRHISYCQCGAPSGFPVVYFHPQQGNRFMGLALHSKALELNLRIITPDRPGFGRSTPQPDRTVLQYSEDVAQLCDQLHIDRFAAIASSAGGMYALACTQNPATKHRLAGAITLIPPWIPPSCNPHWSGLGALGAISCCIPAAAFSAVMGCVNRHIVASTKKDGALAGFSKICSKEEAKVLEADPDAQAAIAAFAAELDQTRSDAVGLETQLCLERNSKVGFDYIEDVVHPVRVYIGSSDSMLSASAVQEWAKRCLTVEAIIVPKGTHEGIMFAHSLELLQRLAAEVHASAG